MENNKIYLGDGLYAHFDGYHIILTAPRENGEHYVGLEHSVFTNLLTMAERVWGVKITITDHEG